MLDYLKSCVFHAWITICLLYIDEQQDIWKKKDSEVVIAVVESPDKTDQFILRQTDFNSLAPQKWLLGEVTFLFVCFFTQQPSPLC